MGRPKGGQNSKYTVEEKLNVVNMYLIGNKGSRTLEKDIEIPHRNIERWVQSYLKKGVEGLKETKKTGNKYAALHTSKKLSEIERLKLELMKKDIEIERLKKGYLVKGDGQQKRYITTSKENFK